MNTWLLSQSWAIANITEVVFALFWSSSWIHLLDALWLETWHTNSFTGSSAAWMATSVGLIARLLHHVEAFTLSADISKCRFHTWGRLLELFLAEAASWGIVLITCLSNMVGFSVALSTEILLTLWAPNSMICHMLSCFGRNRVSIIVFQTLLRHSWLHHHNITALATDHVRVTLNNIHHNILVNLFLLFFIQILFKLKFLDNTFTSWAKNILTFRFERYRLFSKAIYVDLMEAIGWLQHCAIVGFHFPLVNLFITEMAQPVFSILLNLFIIGLSS